MYDVLRSSINTCSCLFEPDTTSNGLEPDPANIWLFTDPAAHVAYRFAQQLEALKEDIQANVMFDGRWAPDEIELKYEIRRLLAGEYLVSKGTFGYLSPHPSVYRAKAMGELHITGHRLCFEAGDDLLFLPWLLRVSRPGHEELVHIGHLRTLRGLGLCSDAFPVTRNLYGKGLAILRERLYSLKPRSD